MLPALACATAPAGTAPAAAGETTVVRAPRLDVNAGRIAEPAVGSGSMYFATDAGP